MKNFSPQSKTDAPSVFQVAAQLDDFVAAHPAAPLPLNQKMPFTDLMLHPEKVEAVLKVAEEETRISRKKPARNKAAAGRRTKRNTESAGAGSV